MVGGCVWCVVGLDPCSKGGLYMSVVSYACMRMVRLRLLMKSAGHQAASAF